MTKLIDVIEYVIDAELEIIDESGGPKDFEEAVILRNWLKTLKEALRDY